MATFVTPEPITAVLTTGGARVRVAASERADTVVRVEPVSASRSDAKVAERTEVEFAGGELSVRTRKSGEKSGSVAITVELPAGSTLVLNTAFSDVLAEGVLGDCELNVASGQVRLDRVAGLRGRLAAGEVAVGHVAGAIDLDGGTAGVRIAEAAGAVRYEGSSGKVWIGHAHADLDLSGAGGSFDIDRADGDVTAKAADCPIRIGRLTRGQAELMNASGGIEVGVAAHTAATVDADSTKGAVRNSLPAQAGPVENTVKVHARTRVGDIVVRPA